MVSVPILTTEDSDAGKGQTTRPGGHWLLGPSPNVNLGSCHRASRRTEGAGNHRVTKQRAAWRGQEELPDLPRISRVTPPFTPDLIPGPCPDPPNHRPLPRPPQGPRDNPALRPAVPSARAASPMSACVSPSAPTPSAPAWPARGAPAL